MSQQNLHRRIKSLFQKMVRLAVQRPFLQQDEKYQKLYEKIRIASSKLKLTEEEVIELERQYMFYIRQEYLQEFK